MSWHNTKMRDLSVKADNALVACLGGVSIMLPSASALFKLAHILVQIRSRSHRMHPGCLGQCTGGPGVYE